MRVFITGATGFIGSAIVEDLLAAGHQVVGLARSDASAKLLESFGVEVLRGSLDDLDSLKRGAAGSDGVIHCAFIHDFSDFATSAKKDHLAIQTLGAALEGTNRPLVITSGTLGLGLTPGRLATEEDRGDPAKNPRVASEDIALSFASKDVRSSVIRLPPSVHGKGDHALSPCSLPLHEKRVYQRTLVKGSIAGLPYTASDTAQLYRLVLEKGTAGAKYHGVSDEGIPFRDIAQAIGRHLNVPVVSKTIEEAADHFGWFGNFIAIDNPTSSKQTQQELGWHPSQTSLLVDLDENYF